MKGKQPTGFAMERAQRLLAIRLFKGKSGPQFAEWLGIEYPRWNNFERGFPLPANVAMLLCDKVPGLTLDYLYRGRIEGMHYDLVERLREAEAAKSSTG